MKKFNKIIDFFYHFKSSPFVRPLIDRILYCKSRILLKKIDKKIIPDKRNEVRLFLTVRDEELRLPHLFSYYKSLGVDRFFVIDNRSKDQTVNFLLSRNDTHVFKIKEKWRRGIYWKYILLNKFGLNHWCIMADADEILVYPNYTQVDLKKLCKYLDQEESTALKSLWIDMYSDKSIIDSTYVKGTPFLETFKYFDKNCLKEGPPSRVFGWRPELDKSSLLKYTKGMIIDAGQHRIKGKVRYSRIKGAVLHFKFASDFISRTDEQVKREEALLKSAKHKKFKKVLDSNYNISLYYKDSIKFESEKQLVDLGIMQTTQEYEEYVNNSFATKEKI